MLKIFKKMRKERNDASPQQVKLCTTDYPNWVFDIDIVALTQSLVSSNSSGEIPAQQSSSRQVTRFLRKSKLNTESVFKIFWIMQFVWHNCCAQTLHESSSMLTLSMERCLLWVHLKCRNSLRLRIDICSWLLYSTFLNLDFVPRLKELSREIG